MNTLTLEGKTTLKDELRFIPTAGWVVAGLFFLAWFVGFIVFFAPHAVHGKPGEPPLWLFRLLMILPGLALTAIVLMVFYVNVDAGRRRMNRLLWTLLVIFIPNAIGFIIYFVLRQPIPRPCPQCHTLLRPDFTFCPSCGGVLAPLCPNCHRAVEHGWATCAFCGSKLS
jgi:RNA polymerase subunit RPABC4/transcription elongation factor Spt4